VWRSADGGAHWVRVVSGHVSDLATTKAGVLFAAGGTDVGVQRSDDGGITWTPVPVGLPPSAAVDRAAIDVAERGESRTVVVAFVNVEGGTLGLYSSTNDGLAWTPVPSTDTPCDRSTIPSYDGQCWYDLTILAEPQGTVLLGGIELHRVDLATGTSTPLGFGVVHVDQHALARDARGRIWLGNDGGVYRSGDRGARWVPLNRGLPITQLNHGAAVLPGGGLLDGTQDNGTILRRRGAWLGVLGADGGAAVAWPGDSFRALASMQYLVLWRSGDGGETWAPGDDGILPGEPRSFYAPLVGVPSKPGTAYAGTNRVYRTTDAGRSWQAMSPPLGRTGLVAIAPAPSDPKTVYAAGGQVVWATHDDGTTWQPVSVTARDPATTSLQVDPRDPRHVWRTLLTRTRAPVLESRDGGATWADAGAGLPQVPAYDVELDRRTGDLYAATERGVFRLTGRTWSAEPVGMPAVIVSDLVIRDGRELVAATHGRGYFVAQLP
jgi:photosystem II stability/assembly factor-like uncharacterized protein